VQWIRNSKALFFRSFVSFCLVFQGFSLTSKIERARKKRTQIDQRIECACREWKMSSWNNWLYSICPCTWRSFRHRFLFLIDYCRCVTHSFQMCKQKWQWRPCIRRHTLFSVYMCVSLVGMRRELRLVLVIIYLDDVFNVIWYKTTFSIQIIDLFFSFFVWSNPIYR